MRIGDLARRTGASVRSLRYYEECGLIAPVRSASGQRHYRDADAERVTLIRQLLAAGLGTGAIRDVLPCMAEPGAQTSSLTARLVREHERITAEIEQREATRRVLSRIIEAAPPLG